MKNIIYNKIRNNIFNSMIHTMRDLEQQNKKYKKALIDMKDHIEIYKELKDEYNYDDNLNLKSIKTRCMIDADDILNIVNKALGDYK